MLKYKLIISLDYCENMTFSGETDNITNVLISHAGLIENGIKTLIFKDGKKFYLEHCGMTHDKDYIKKWENERVSKV